MDIVSLSILETYTALKLCLHYYSLLPQKQDLVPCLSGTYWLASAQGQNQTRSGPQTLYIALLLRLCAPCDIHGRFVGVLGEQ